MSSRQISDFSCVNNNVDALASFRKSRESTKNMKCKQSLISFPTWDVARARCQPSNISVKIRFDFYRIGLKVHHGN